MPLTNSFLTVSLRNTAQYNLQYMKWTLCSGRKARYVTYRCPKNQNNVTKLAIYTPNPVLQLTQTTTQLVSLDCDGETKHPEKTQTDTRKTYEPLKIKTTGQNCIIHSERNHSLDLIAQSKHVGFNTRGQSGDVLNAAGCHHLVTQPSGVCLPHYLRCARCHECAKHFRTKGSFLKKSLCRDV